MRNILFDMLRDSFPNCKELEYSFYGDAIADTGGVIISPESTSGITVIIDEPFIKDYQISDYGELGRRGRNVFRISTTTLYCLSVNDMYIRFLVIISPTKEQLVETVKGILEAGNIKIGNLEVNDFESHIDLAIPLAKYCKSRDNTTGTTYYYNLLSNRSFVRTSFLYELEISRSKEQYIMLTFSLVTMDGGSSINHRTTFYSRKPRKLIMSSFPSDFKVNKTRLGNHYALQSNSIPIKLESELVNYIEQVLEFYKHTALILDAYR